MGCPVFRSIWKYPYIVYLILPVIIFYNFASDTSVDFTSATTSEPTLNSSSLMERVVMTDVTVPNGVPTSIGGHFVTTVQLGSPSIHRVSPGYNPSSSRLG